MGNSMKAIISTMIIIVGVLVFLIFDTDVTDTPKSSEQYEAKSNLDKDSSIGEETSADGATETNKLYSENSSNENDLSDSGINSRYNHNATYENNSSSYQNNGSSYEQDRQSYGNTNSSYNQVNSSTSNTPSVSQTNSNTVRDNSRATENVDKDSKTTEEENTKKFQRLYDNGIMWYGETGTLNIEYQSSHAETTGIGFRVHYDSSSIRPINITQYPVDAIITTSPSIATNDSDNRDNNLATNSFLPFAWASIYGQWPQANELNLATIEFEKVSGGSDNYTINYSAVSVPAGFQLVR